MITPAEARALVEAGEPARQAERDKHFYEDCQRVENEIRTAASERGAVAISINGIRHPSRVATYLKQCGFAVHCLGENNVSVWW